MNKAFFKSMREQMTPSEKVINELYAKIKSTEGRSETIKQHKKIRIVDHLGRYVVATACITLITIFLNFNMKISTNNPGSVTDGITIPSMELPDDNSAMDMIGIVVYKGKIYTQAEYLYVDEKTRSSFVGKYLGTASGTIDEWSQKDEYQQELASNVIGDVYTVNGYDPDFRICIPKMYEDIEFIAFFENLNGITLKNGNDLYGNRLHLKEDYIDVTYQLHSDWNYEKGNFKKFREVTTTNFNQFIDVLNQSPFVELKGEPSIYNSDILQTHLFFKMKDGTTVELRLFENGYVGYQGMHGQIFVHITDDIFNQIFSAALQ